MALKASYDIRCSCGAGFTGEVYEYVFAQHDPDLRDAILSGEFNRIPCPSCGQRLAVENRFLYRDEENRLWVWVCGKDEEGDRDALRRDLLETNRSMDSHFLDDAGAYRKHLVFGRDGLLELLWQEDRALRTSEERPLKRNPAFRLILGEKEAAGFLLLSGRKLRLALPLRYPDACGVRLRNREERIRWIRAYADGVNVHNPYGSFLGARWRTRWDRVREREPWDGIRDGFADFAESWACRSVDSRRLAARFPERRAFLEALGKPEVARTVRTLRPQRTRGVSRRRP